MSLTADWVCGFPDGEATSLISIESQPRMVLGKQVRLGFKIAQGEEKVVHHKVMQPLYKIKELFGVGVLNHSEAMALYGNTESATSRQSPHHILPFFAKHKLYTTKKFDSLRVQHVCAMMMRGEHLTVEGLAKIERIGSKINSFFAGRQNPFVVAI